ncbi:MAG: Adenylate kinase [Candidatus Levybacteria bacterium GW2011_GWB1_39_7]|nr:MAG: Adenylate kinase [Candidatus Levybacteria bacterium GW2011_GWA1_39_11]KKR24990.1 MAG: Adenylate kinase [Candidatus Levybacteria bacterium GW2011_GWB1_39_7]KKR27547.1 MAG: Adenylate kinase [Microgenomates group bacterium GW2011_GWC1_39_7]KKR48405.1 MAG: Adenylate kinase [Candidatus Levybacteria bacterium GW2011_GWA2_40_16]
MKIVLIGIQGSGKSTQGNLLAEKLKVPYLSTGHIFREIAKEHTPMGRYIKEIMNSGYLIPDEKTLEIVSDYLSRPEYQKGYILDGFPRTKVQAESFKNGIDAVLYIKVLDEEAIRRLSLRRDNREDEAPRALKKRIESFHKFTIPVLEYYKEKGKLHEINGERTIEEIHRDICGILGVASNGQ